ncbi:MAG: DUF4105 domain-containing protein [Bacteroidales bacterium]|jgi:hypothetical protein|nr:DUF4105 domain-containing protein [Bacteroidales bacterium]
MKKLYFLLLAICLQTFALAENNYQISILTCSTGDEIYSVFGHTAIRVKQQESDLDLVFNFGMFDFSTDYFAFKFAKGTLLYCLGVQQTDHFAMEYTYDNRLVTEQVLNLTDAQKETILRKLDFLYQPENRYYRYAFIEKNCATEIRDILTEAGINFKIESISLSERDLIESYLPHHKWLRLGINLALGRTIDKPSNTYRSMFLPDDLHDELEKADQEIGNVIAEEHVLNSITEREYKSDWWYSPFFIFSILFIISLFIKHKGLPITLFSIIGLVGLLLLVLNIFSLHTEVKQNFNILWCNPLYFIYLPFILKNKSNKWLPIIFLSTIGLTILIWITGFQIFDWAIIPILLMLAWQNGKQLMMNR